jgi:DNA-binding beta-propeller fold protein YncE
MVVGVTSLAGQLFVARESANQQIEVYDATTFSFQKHISVPGLNTALGLASCAVNNCLYASNFSCGRVCKVDLSLSNKIVEWPVGKNPTGLFVNDSNNLLVTVRGDLILQEWTTQGSLIREVSLQQSGITSPWYSMQQRSGQFLIGDSSRLCCVDANGSLLSSHGKTAGSAIDQLNCPVGLVQGQNGSILIADRL